MPYTGGTIISELRNAVSFKTGMAKLLVLFVLLKGLIPLGYMPDMTALQTGTLKITICTAYGVQEVAGDSQQQPHHGKSDFCPFGWMPHSALSVAAPFILPVLFLLPQRMAAFQELFLSEPRQTLAQPRAPPAIL